MKNGGDLLLQRIHNLTVTIWKEETANGLDKQTNSPIDNVVRQGDGLSTMLFNIALEGGSELQTLVKL